MPVYEGLLFNDSIIPTAEVAALLGVSVWSVQRLARTGVLTAHNEYGFGLSLWFKVSEVQKLKLKRANRIRPGPALYVRPNLCRKRKPEWGMSNQLRMLLDNAVRQLLDAEPPY